jgi:hypothetical protein
MPTFDLIRVQLVILQAFSLGFSTKLPRFSRVFRRGAAEKDHGAYPYRCSNAVRSLLHEETI